MSKVKMKPSALLLMLFTLFLLGLVSATSLNANINNTISVSVTPISAVEPTRVVPRRNGYSDLPLYYMDYAASHPSNAVPPFVMATSPWNMGDNNAVRYSRGDIYSAM